MGKLNAIENRDAAPSLQSEPALLIAIARVEPDTREQNQIADLLKQSLNWNSLLLLAERHNLEPLLYHHLHRYGSDHVPAEAMERLSKESRKIAGRTFVLASKLQKISTHLQDCGIQHICYKGPLFAESYYGSCALRVSNDLDLIVHPSDLATVRQALAEIGFHDQNNLSDEQQEASFRFGFEHPFHGTGGVDLDLHWRIVQKFKSRSLDMDGIWQRIQYAELFGEEVPTFCPEDALVAMCLHAGHHGWMQLSHFCDIAQLLRAHPKLDWEVVSSHLGDSNTRRMLFVCWHLLQKHWSAHIPHEILDRISADRHVATLVRRIEIEIWQSPRPKLTTASFRWLVDRSAGEDIQDRLILILGSVFQPAVEDFVMFQLPRFLTPLYPVLRACRLAAKGAFTWTQSTYRA